jgi:ABC-2 type transport system permease protein
VIALVRSELRKVTTTKTVFWLLLLAIVMAGAVTALFTLFQVLAEVPIPLGSIEGQRAILGNLATQSGAHVIMLALGVLALGSEFRHGTITSTLLASPRRARVVVAKLAVVIAVGLVYAVAAIAVGLAVYLVWMQVRGVDVTLGGEGGLWRILLGNVLVLVLYGAIGMGVGAMIRNQIVALIVAIIYAWILDGLIAFGLNAIRPLRDAGVAAWLPGEAASGLQWASDTPAPGQPAFSQIDFLPQWAAGLVLLGWAVLFCVIGIRLALSRDIT